MPDEGPITTRRTRFRAAIAGWMGASALAGALVWSGVLSGGLLAPDRALLGLPSPLPGGPPPASTDLRAARPAEPALGLPQYATVPLATLRWQAKAEDSAAPALHAVNFGLHLAVTLLLFPLVRRVRMAEDRAREVGPRSGTTTSVRTTIHSGTGRLHAGAGAAALLFACLPVHAEAIASVAARDELLGALLGLASWYAHLLGGPVAHLVSLALYLLSCQCRAGLAFLPLAWIAWDLIRERGLVYAAHRYGAKYLALAGMAALSAWLGGRPPSLAPSVDALAGAAPLERLLTWARLSWTDAFLPLVSGLGLASGYGRPAVAISPTTDPLAWACLGGILVALVAAAAAWAWGARSGPAWTAFFLLTLLPTTPLFGPRAEIGAERLLYLPSVAWCAWLGIGWAAVRRRWRGRLNPIAAGLLGVAVLGYGLTAYRRAFAWADEVTLRRSTVESRPADADAHAALGAALLARPEAQSALEEAIRCLGASLRLEPRPGVRALRAYALVLHRDLDAAEAEAREALRAGDRLALAHLVLGEVCLARGRPQEAIDACRRALELDPGMAEAHAGIGQAHFKDSRLEPCLEACRAAVRLKPRLAAARTCLGQALEATGDPDGARHEYEDAVRAEPDFGEARYRLALAYTRGGDARAAREWMAFVEIAQRQPWLRDRVPTAMEYLRGLGVGGH